jgi:hypothetical protein
LVENRSKQQSKWRKNTSSKLPKDSNRFKIAPRNTANASGNLNDSTPFRDFFDRINFRKGRVSAIIDDVKQVIKKMLSGYAIFKLTEVQFVP